MCSICTKYSQNIWTILAIRKKKKNDVTTTMIKYFLTTKAKEKYLRDNFRFKCTIINAPNQQHGNPLHFTNE